MRAGLPLRIGFALLTLGAATGCPGIHPNPPASEIGEADRARHARHRLEDARAFLSQGRLEAAERALRRGLEVGPQNPQLHRTLARVLAEQGRAEAAERHRLHADAIDPPPPPPPEAPLDLPSLGILVALLPRDPGDEPPERAAPRWPEGPIAETLEERLRVRLPRATVVHADPPTVARARRWLPEHAPRAVISLRVDRAYCGESLKDGRFAVAWLRVAAEAPGRAGSGPRQIRETVVDPRLPGSCRREAVARALERVLEGAEAREALRAPAGPSARWSTPAIRALFPGIGRRIEEELRAGQMRLAAGEIGAAAEAFARAARIDPEDPDVRVYREEAAATLAMLRELGGSGPPEGAADRLDPRLSPAQRNAAEARLAEEQRRREQLLAALAVLEEDTHAPPPPELAAIHSTPIRNRDAFGPRLARARSGGEIEARTIYAPDGALLARYYFPTGSDLPILREEDLDGDGRPDRWTGYARATRTEVWEDGHGAGHPDLHLVFASAGTPLQRIEVDADGDGRVERVFHYTEGSLDGEDTDTDGDGVLDRFDRFDDEGHVGVREEDVDGDGQIDVHSVYQGGKLVLREFADREGTPDDI